MTDVTIAALQAARKFAQDASCSAEMAHTNPLTGRMDLEGEKKVQEAKELITIIDRAILADRERSAGAVPEYQKQEHKAAADAINRLLNGSRSFLDAGTAMKALDKFAARAASPAPAQEAGAVPVTWLVTDKFNQLHVSREGISGAFPVYDRPSPLVAKADEVELFCPKCDLIYRGELQAFMRATEPETSPQPSTEAPGGAAEGWQLVPTQDAVVLRYLMEHCMVEDGNGALAIRWSSSREPRHHPMPERIDWIKGDLEGEAERVVPADSTQGEQSHG